MIFYCSCIHSHQLATCIDKEKALRHDCIYNIENTAIEIGVLGIYLHLLQYFDTHRCSSPTSSFNVLGINLLKQSILRGRGTSLPLLLQKRLSIALDKAAYCVFTQLLGPKNAIKLISVRTKMQ